MICKGNFSIQKYLQKLLISFEQNSISALSKLYLFFPALNIFLLFLKTEEKIEKYLPSKNIQEQKFSQKKIFSLLVKIKKNWRKKNSGFKNWGKKIGHFILSSSTLDSLQKTHWATQVPLSFCFYFVLKYFLNFSRRRPKWRISGLTFPVIWFNSMKLLRGIEKDEKFSRLRIKNFLDKP